MDMTQSSEEMFDRARERLAGGAFLELLSRGLEALELAGEPLATNERDSARRGAGRAGRSPERAVGRAH